MFAHPTAKAANRAIPTRREKDFLRRSVFISLNYKISSMDFAIMTRSPRDFPESGKKYLIFVIHYTDLTDHRHSRNYPRTTCTER
jgi:hypothetical protein